MDRSLNVLIDNINAQIKTLNSQGYKLHDEVDKDYYINEISYNKELDQLEFKCKEVEENESINVN